MAFLSLLARLPTTSRRVRARTLPVSTRARAASCRPDACLDALAMVAGVERTSLPFAPSSLVARLFGESPHSLALSSSRSPGRRTASKTHRSSLPRAVDSIARAFTRSLTDLRLFDYCRSLSLGSTGPFPWPYILFH